MKVKLSTKEQNQPLKTRIFFLLSSPRRRKLGGRI
jgi:hypothetical protein